MTLLKRLQPLPTPQMIRGEQLGGAEPGLGAQRAVCPQKRKLPVPHAEPRLKHACSSSERGRLSSAWLPAGSTLGRHYTAWARVGKLEDASRGKPSETHRRAGTCERHRPL